MLIMAEAPVKPGVFKCPEDFESREYLESDGTIDSEDDYEFVLISAPNDLEFALLDGEELPIRGVQHLRLNKENGIENLRVESQPSDKSSNLTLLLPQKGKIVPAKKFTHYISITKDIEVPSITFPPSSRNIQKLPKGLKQRYTAFGADDPIVTVGEKEVIKRKKKSSKKEKSLQLEETTVQSSKSKDTREKPIKSSREDDAVPQVEKQKKHSRRIKKAKTSSDEELPLPIDESHKVLRKLKKKELRLEESINTSSSDSVGKLSSKEKMKLTEQYINQLDFEIVSASPSSSSKKKTPNIAVLEPDTTTSKKKIRKPKKTSNVETKSKKEKKTSKITKGKDDDDDDENKRKSKEDLINKIMHSQSPKNRARKLKTEGHIRSFSQEY